MSRKLTLLFCVLSLLAGVALYGWFKNNFEWQDVEVEGKMSVQARKHDLLAAGRFLHKLDYQISKIETSDFFLDLPPVSDTIVLQQIPHSLPDVAFDRLLEWVESGGHLLVGLGHSEEYAAATEFMDALGVTITTEFDEIDESHQFTINGANQSELIEAEMQLEHQFTLWAGMSVSLHGGVHDLFAMAQLEHVAGTVTVFADPEFWSNRNIANSDNARLLAVAIAGHASSDSTIHISDINTELPGVFRLIWNQLQWLCLLALVLGLALLRQAWVRFGPVRITPEVRSNNFARHILAVAQFQARYKSYDRLLAPVRARLLSRYNQGAGIRSVMPAAANNYAQNDETNIALEASEYIAPENAELQQLNKSEILFRARQGSGLASAQIADALFEKGTGKQSILQIARTLQAVDRSVGKHTE